MNNDKEDLDLARKQSAKRIRKWAVAQTLLTLIIAGITLTTMSYVYYNTISKVIEPADGQIEYAKFPRLDSLVNQMTIMSAAIDSLRHFQRQETTSAMISQDLQLWIDSLTHVAAKVKTINDAISPQSVTEIITLQRLGDKYIQLLQTIGELKADIKEAQLKSDDALGKHAARINDELDRFTPMIWGMLSVIALIVIQNVWTQRSQRREQRQEETNV